MSGVGLMRLKSRCLHRGEYFSYFSIQFLMVVGQNFSFSGYLMGFISSF